MSEFIDHAIHFILQHNEPFVQWMVVAVVVWAALLIGTSIFSKPPKDSYEPMLAPHSGAGTSASTVANTTTVVQGASSAVSDAMAAEMAAKIAAASAESQSLRMELAVKAKELEAAKAQGGSGKSDGAELATYLKKIKDLEGKLSEYEILEDDIADLSLYKEENARLKTEVDRLSSGAPAPKLVVPPPAAEPEPVAAVAEPIVEESLPPVTEEAKKKSDELVAEFTTAVTETKAPPPPVAADDLAAAASAAAVIAPLAPAQEEPAATAEGDDLLTEFAASLEEPGGLDTSKMLEEVAALGEAPADTSSSLEEDADISKLADEADNLLGKES